MSNSDAREDAAAARRHLEEALSVQEKLVAHASALQARREQIERLLSAAAEEESEARARLDALVKRRETLAEMAIKTETAARELSEKEALYSSAVRDLAAASAAAEAAAEAAARRLLDEEEGRLQEEEEALEAVSHAEGALERADGAGGEAGSGGESDGANSPGAEESETEVEVEVEPPAGGAGKEGGSETESEEPEEEKTAAEERRCADEQARLERMEHYIKYGELEEALKLAVTREERASVLEAFREGSPMLSAMGEFHVLLSDAISQLPSTDLIAQADARKPDFLCALEHYEVVDAESMRQLLSSQSSRSKIMKILADVDIPLELMEHLIRVFARAVADEGDAAEAAAATEAAAAMAQMTVEVEAALAAAEAEKAEAEAAAAALAAAEMEAAAETEAAAEDDGIAGAAAVAGSGDKKKKRKKKKGGGGAAGLPREAEAAAGGGAVEGAGAAAGGTGAAAEAEGLTCELAGEIVESGEFGFILAEAIEGLPAEMREGAVASRAAVLRALTEMQLADADKMYTALTMERAPLESLLARRGVQGCSQLLSSLQQVLARRRFSSLKLQEAVDASNAAYEEERLAAAAREAAFLSNESFDDALSDDTVLVEEPVKCDACAWCGTLAAPSRALSRCGKCQRVAYCSKECQRQHWCADGGNHKARCNKRVEIADLRHISKLPSADAGHLVAGLLAEYGAVDEGLAVMVLGHGMEWEDRTGLDDEGLLAMCEAGGVAAVVRVGRAHIQIGVWLPAAVTALVVR